MKKVLFNAEFFVVLFITVLLQPRTWAYAATNSPYVLKSNTYFDLTGVSPSILNASKDCCYIIGSCERTERIAKTCDHHIYCFKATNGGYYEFSTIPCPGSYDPTTRNEGLYDTIGAVYTVNNGTPVRLAYSNGGSMRFFGNENGRKSCSIKVYLDKNQEVFFVVRGYQGFTGRYTLIIEPNEDVTKAKEEIGSSQPIWKNSASGNGIYYREVRYFDKTASCILYQLLDDTSEFEVDGTIITLEDLIYTARNGNYSNTQMIIDGIVTLLGCVPCYGDAIAIGYYIFNVARNSDIPTINQYRKDLADLCGIKRKISGLVTTFFVENGMYQKISNSGKTLNYNELCPVDSSDYDSDGNVFLKSTCGGHFGTWSGL